MPSCGSAQSTRDCTEPTWYARMVLFVIRSTTAYSGTNGRTSRNDCRINCHTADKARHARCYPGVRFGSFGPRYSVSRTFKRVLAQSDESYFSPMSDRLPCLFRWSDAAGNMITDIDTSQIPEEEVNTATFRTGSWEPLNGKETMGTVSLRTLDDGMLQVAFSEDFSVSDGPGLFVYLSNGETPSTDFINLGDFINPDRRTVFTAFLITSPSTRIRTFWYTVHRTKSHSLLLHWR
jgi:hypothetical protein